MSKGKVNPNKMPLTKMDLKIAEKKWKDQLETMKLESIADATLFVECVTYLALCNRFGFGEKECAEIKEEFDRIADKIGDTKGKDRNYCLETVKKELKKYGINVKGVWI